MDFGMLPPGDQLRADLCWFPGEADAGRRGGLEWAIGLA